MEHVLTAARMLPSIIATANAITEVLYNNLDADSTSDGNIVTVRRMTHISE